MCVGTIDTRRECSVGSPGTEPTGGWISPGMGTKTRSSRREASALNYQTTSLAMYSSVFKY